MRLQKLPQTELHTLRVYPMGSPMWIQQYSNGRLQLSKRYNLAEGLSSSQEFKHGIKHGWYTDYFHQSKQIQYQSHYQNGLQDGPARQWDLEGLLLVHSDFNAGTGFDCWICWHENSDQYYLGEAAQYQKGTLEGYQRFYSKPGQLLEETYYSAGKTHGLKRAWNPDGSLQKSYPQLYFQGELIAFATRPEAAKQFGFEYPKKDDQPFRRTSLPTSTQVYVPLALTP